MQTPGNPSESIEDFWPATLLTSRIPPPSQTKQPSSQGALLRYHGTVQ
jgi:hypothetical protein